MSKLKLQPFCGEAIDADWIRLKIQAKAKHGVTKVRTIDCAMVPKLNEQFIITGDVMSQQRIYRRRSRREQQLAITPYVTRMGIMGNLLPD